MFTFIKPNFDYLKWKIRFQQFSEFPPFFRDCKFKHILMLGLVSAAYLLGGKKISIFTSSGLITISNHHNKIFVRYPPTGFKTNFEHLVY